MFRINRVTLSRNRYSHRLLKINFLATSLTESCDRNIHIGENFFIAGSLWLRLNGFSICNSRN